jgi:hypothetical protein
LVEELRERQNRTAAQAKRLTELKAKLRALRDEIHGNLPPAE